MIISYPFLPDRADDISDEAYEKSILDMEMLEAGVYPASYNFQWHGGIHLRAPNSNEPVRAIADGTLVAYRLNNALLKERPEDAVGKLDNSFVLIRHETESDAVTSAGKATPTKVAFYSLYMHLMNTGDIQSRGIDRGLIHSSIQDSGQAVKKGAGAKIYRKDIIGFSGESYSTGGVIHFEIFMSDADLAEFFVDSRNVSQVGQKGTWGDSYFVVKAGAPVVAAHPRGESIGGHNFPLGVPGTIDASQVLYVRIAYKGGKKQTTTWLPPVSDGPLRWLTPEDGVEDAGYEYDMYKIATALYPSCPSAGMEMLRFGKIIGPDASHLAARERHNWQLVTFAEGKAGYVDLADANVTEQVLSDADFPHWMGWQKNEGQLFGDFRQCDMSELMYTLQVPKSDVSDTKKRELKDFLNNPGNQHVRTLLQKWIGRMHSEWDSSTNGRCIGLKEKNGIQYSVDGPFVGAEDEFEKHMQFVESIQWWEDSGLGVSNVWHIHPLGFIKHFRKCGWLSLRELAQVVQGSHDRTIESVSRLFTTELRAPHNSAQVRRPSGLYIPLMGCMRKYGIVGAKRQAQWFGQILRETGTFLYMRELGDNAYLTNYYEGRCHEPIQRMIRGRSTTLSPLGNCHSGDGVRYSGKGMIQLTGGDNYRKYQKYRGGTNFTIDPGPELLVTDPYSACDTCGYYWISKQRYKKDAITHRIVLLGKASVNYWVDSGDVSDFQDISGINDVIDDVTRCINVSLDGRDDRRQYFKHAYAYLSDMVENFPSEFRPLR